MRFWKCHETIFIVEIARLFPLHQFNYLWNVRVISVRQWIDSGPCECVSVCVISNRWPLKCCSIPSLHAQVRKQSVVFYPKWERGQSEPGLEIYRMKTTACPIRSWNFPFHILWLNKWSSCISYLLNILWHNAKIWTCVRDITVKGTVHILNTIFKKEVILKNAGHW